MTSQRNLYHDLLEQRAFLDASCQGFDGGLQIEAKRLAVTIRVLVHDTANSHSLLEQLGIKNSLKWISSGEVDPRNMVSTMGLTSMRMAVQEDGTQTFEYAAKDEATVLQFGKLKTFAQWWETPVIKDSDGEHFTRRDLVLALANKDGGAHIDTLQTRVRRLAHEGSLGWMFGPGPDEAADDITLEQELILLNPILASVRTIAEEMRLSFHNQESILSPE